ncbi:MAG: glgX 1 [Nitrospira sp.]|nr:glgX 1 [Nitrospira sp.]
MPSPGQSAPLGATVLSGGVNFSLYSRDATGLELLLFDQVEDAKPSKVFEHGGALFQE